MLLAQLFIHINIVSPAHKGQYFYFSYFNCTLLMICIFLHEQGSCDDEGVRQISRWREDFEIKGSTEAGAGEKLVF